MAVRLTWGRDRLRRTLPAVLAAVLVAGCAGAGPGGGADRPREAASGAATAPRELALPLDPYQPSPAHLDLLRRARHTLLVRCTRRLGVDPPPAAPVIPLPPAGNAQRYGLADGRDARAHGYHLPGMAPDAVKPLTALSPAQEAVLTGSGPATAANRPIPEGGCYGEAERTLDSGAPTAEDPNLGQLLGLESFARSKQHPRVRAAFGSWSACMRRAGFSYGDPMQANDDPAFRTERPSRAEIAVAVADVDCKREVGLVDVWASVEAAYQERALDRRAGELEAVRRLLDVRGRNAARVVAGTAP